MSKQNVYCIYDKVADETLVLSMSKTDGLFIRQNLPYMSKINPNYANDMLVYKIGEYVDSTKSLIPLEPVVVDWTAYNNPEQPANSVGRFMSK